MPKPKPIATTIVIAGGTSTRGASAAIATITDGTSASAPAP